VNEPANHSALVDRFGDTWVRADDVPGRNGSWWPLTDGTGWEPWARTGVGQARTWPEVEEYAPLTEADPDRAARALAMVREEAAR
jgi:hypothetical protein